MIQHRPDFNAILRCLFVYVVLVTSPLSLAETFYKWRDAAGTWVYGAHPPAGVDAVAVKTTIGRSTAIQPENTEQDQGTSTETDAQAEGEKKELIAEKKSGISKKKRKELCQKAKNNLDALSSSAVIRQRDADGNVTVLSEEDREKEVEKAELAVKEYC